MGPYNHSYNDKAVPLDDLERGHAKGLHVTAIPVSSASERPILGRRQTTSDLLTTKQVQKAIKGDDTLNRVSNFISKVHDSSIIVRYALYILPIGALLAIPLALTFTIVPNSSIDYVRTAYFCIWLEIIWVSLWVCKLVTKTFPLIWQNTAGLFSAGVRKYAVVLKRLEIPISLLLWTITAWASTYLLRCDKALQGFSDAHPEGLGDDPFYPPWQQTLNKVLKASIVVAAILVAEKTIIQLISVNYHRKQYEHKIKASKKLILLLDMLYDASRKLYPEFSPEFEEEDAEIQGNAYLVREGLAKAGLRTKFVTDIGRAGDKVTAALGEVLHDITGKQVLRTTAAHAIVIEALETQRASKALARRLWLSFVPVGKDALFKADLVEVLGHDRMDEAELIFSALDCDGNGDVSLAEMTALVVSAGIERKNRAKSMADIGEAISVLDRLLGVVFLIATGFVYAAFFSNAFANSSTQLFSIVTGLAFAIGGTVTEFLACCIFLFVKHPYDVSDRVDIDGKELIVEHISLMYSVFRRLDSDKAVQIPHNVANGLWIENVSRSAAQKERFTFSISAATSADDIEILRGQLEQFVRADENRRDFKDTVDIHLVGIGDLKALELRCEVRYKSNCANETLRQQRRNKFMCKLLEAMRKVPIEPPGGSAPSLGDFKNPSYTVAVSDADAVLARERHAEEVKAKRFVLPVTSPFETVTTALPNALQGMAETINGQRDPIIRPRMGRSSLESHGRRED